MPFGRGAGGHRRGKESKGAAGKGSREEEKGGRGAKRRLEGNREGEGVGKSVLERQNVDNYRKR